MTNRWIKKMVETAERTDIQMPWGADFVGSRLTVDLQKRLVSKGETDA